jgi:hypothetical protein
MGDVQVVRIHDPARRPPSAMAAIRPGQFVVFAKDLAGGGPCDFQGRAYADAEHAECAICDSLAEARAFGEAAVGKIPSLRLDIFDAEGRSNSPLLTLMHPSRALEADTHPRVLRRRRVIAWTLIALGIPLIVFAYVEHRERDIILPAFIGINMLLAAGRLLWFNLGVRETERVREERLRNSEPQRPDPPAVPNRRNDD